MSGEVEELLRVLGPFYELVEEKKKISQISDLSPGGFFIHRRALGLFVLSKMACGAYNVL